MAEICEFWHKTCFVKCDGRNHETCFMKETHKEAYKGQKLFQSDELKLDV